MKFKINESVFDKFPNLVVAIPLIYGFDNTINTERSVEILRENEEKLRHNLDLSKLPEDERIRSYTDTFGRFGVDPDRHLPAHLALAKRVLEGGELPDINPLVNLYNALSIGYVTPFGGEDLDTVYGDFELKFANGGERWIPIGSKKSKSAIKGELVWGDDLDLSTRALNWRQCERTKLTKQSKNGYFIMDGFSNINEENIREAAKDFVEKATNLFGGNAEIIWLSKSSPEVEIGFASKDIKDHVATEIKPSPVRTKQKKDVTKTVMSLMALLNGVVKTLGKDIEVEINLEHPSDGQFGDYSTNVAMLLAKTLKENPRKIAEIIREKMIALTLDDKLIDKIEVAGAGFINIYLAKPSLIQIAERVNYSIEFKKEIAMHGKDKTMVIDYSAPNIAKPFGIGHLRSTNIGQALYNIYQILGWNCVGDNHLGDWGTQFGKMMAAYKHWGDKPLAQMTIADLETLYVRFHHEAETNPELVTEGQQWFAKLEQGDAEAREMWQNCVDTSIVEFNRVYELLGVKIDNAYGEAFYEPMLPDIIQEIKSKNLTKNSQGAVIVEFDDMTPAMLLKSDGATTYFTRDMATIKFRMRKWQPDLIIYEVGAEQELHFKQVFKAAEMMGWIDSDKLVHIGHGLIRWKTGKFSTRKGDTIHLSDVIDKAMEAAEKIANSTSVSKGLGVTERAAMIKAVAIGAIKFNDLSSDPKKDVIFDWDKVMSMEGSSGPYLQYTYARCLSVLAKTEIKELKNIVFPPELINDEELKLLRQLARLEEALIEAAARYSPAVLAEYLIATAQLFNEFYGKYRIIGQPEEDWRIFLTKTTSSVIKTGLEVLGIQAVEKM
jgi:arginyl-tRNA synthetase